MIRRMGVPFLIVGLVFFALGFGGQRTFFAIGAAFIAVGVVFWLRQKRTGRAM